MSVDPEPQALAKACSAALHERDRAAQMLGISIVETGPGHCELSMTVTESMLNGHGVCHGGLLFALADTALAHASNSRNRVSVASICSIDFLRPAAVGAVVTASVMERFRGRRKSSFDIELRDGETRLLALFRGETVSFDKAVIGEGSALK
jgi:acyl-CoA thioesterase